jgi:hypothetical protein
MARKINIERFPDRYQAIVDTISEKKGLQPSDEEKNTAQDNARIFKRVARIRRIYLVFLIIAWIALLWRISHSSDLKDNLENLLYAILWTAIYYGLLFKSGWIIPLIFINSALSCVSSLSNIFHPAENIKAVFFKVIFCLMFFFFFYQIIYFSKREVRRYFRDRGKILFY